MESVERTINPKIGHIIELSLHNVIQFWYESFKALNSFYYGLKVLFVLQNEKSEQQIIYEQYVPISNSDWKQKLYYFAKGFWKMDPRMHFKTYYYNGMSF